MADVQKKAAPAAEGATKTPAKTVKKKASNVDSEEKQPLSTKDGASPPKMKKIVKRPSGEPVKKAADGATPKKTPAKKPASVAGEDTDASSKPKKVVKKAASTADGDATPKPKKPVEKGIDTPKKKATDEAEKTKDTAEKTTDKARSAAPATPKKKVPATSKPEKEASKPVDDASQADNEEQKDDDDVFEDSVEDSANDAAPEEESETAETAKDNLKRVDSGKDLADGDDAGEDTEKPDDEQDDDEEQNDDEGNESGEDDPWKEFKAGLRGKDGDQDQPSKPDSDTESQQLEPLTEEEMAKLTPGKDFDMSKFNSKKADAEDTTETGAEDAEEEQDDEADDKLTNGVSDAEDDAEDAVEDGEDKAKDATDKLGDVAEDTKEAGEEAGDKVKDTATDAGEKAEDTAEEGKDKLDDVAEDTKEAGEEAGDKLKDTAEDATDKAEDATEEGKDKLDDATKDGEDKLDDAAKEGEEATKEGEEQVEGTAKEGEDKLDDATKEGEDKLDDATKEGDESKLDDATKEGEDKLDDATKEGEDAVKEGEEQVEDATKEGEDKLDDATKEGEEAVKEGEEGAEDAVKDGEEAAEGEAEEEEASDLSKLKNGKVNKGGNVMVDGKPLGRISQGVLAHLVGRSVDETGAIWNDSGKKIGQAELIPDDELEALLKEPGPFESFPDATLDGEGYAVFEGERVGKLVEGDPKKLRGMKVDSDGDVLSRAGDCIGKCERWEPEAEPEAEPEPEIDNSILAGKRVNKMGYLVDAQSQIFGRVISGDPRKMVGRMSDKLGIIRSESGDELGRAEVVPEGDREGAKQGPFADLDGCTVGKDGKILTPDNVVVGRLIEGDAKKLFRRPVDSDGEILDGNGNCIGKAERWDEPEEPEKEKGPLAGRKVNKEGLVCDSDGNPLAKLTSGDLAVCAGKEVDDDNDVIVKGTVVGHVTMLADIKEEVEEEEKPEEKEARERAEQDKKLAQQMSYCLTQCLDKVKPICDMIASKIEKADRTPKEELDEEQLVKDVRPLIEQGGKILQEANGIIRGLDPDGRIQANAKHRTSTSQASPEEYRLAEILKELTGTVTKTIEDAKKKLEGMPHAEKELNPLWGLLSEPLFQILAAVGMLLNGVLGLVGRLLSGLGLGGLVDSLLGGLGVKNILEALGVGGLTDSLTGKKSKGQKKKGGLLGLGG